MNFPKFWALGRSGAFMSWRWSNTSLEEAQSAAAQSAQRLAELWTQGKRRLETYGYPDRPMREPMLQEIRNAEGELSAVITRNSYGCHILNTARAMFVDVDLPETRVKSGGLFGALFGRKAEPPPDPAHAVLTTAEDWAKRHPGWNWRIYRTAGGVRLLATHALFDPKDQACQDVFAAMGTDYLYMKLCQTQECFRARLTPKPWRCDTRNPPNRWPFKDHSAELVFAGWDAKYQSSCNGKATCKLLSQGNGQVHPELAPLVTLHDEMTRATSSLPLA